MRIASMNGPVLALVLFAAALSPVGCAFGPGEAFGEVEGVFGAELERRGGRFTEDGWLLPVGSWEVRLDRLEIEVASIRLLETGGASGDAFDPASPPPGWFCHAGHCHTPDDDLVSYDEAALILAGGPSGPTTFVSFPIEDEIDLLESGDALPLDLCIPDCVVGRGTAGLVVVALDHLRLEGVVRDQLADDRLGGETVAIVLDLAGDVEITTRLEEPLRFDRGELPRAILDLQLLVHPSLLDGLAFDTLVEDGAIHIEIPHGALEIPEAAATVFSNLEASRVRVDVERLGHR